MKNAGYYPAVGENMYENYLDFEYQDYELLPDIDIITEEDIQRIRMSEDISKSLEEEKLDEDGNTQFRPWVTQSEFNALVEDPTGNGIMFPFHSKHSAEVIAAIEGLIKSDAPFMDAKIVNLPYRYGENGKKRFDTFYRFDLPEKGEIIPAKRLDGDKVLSLASTKDIAGYGVLNPKFIRKSIREQLLAAEMDVYEFVWFVIHPKWLKLLNLSKAAYRKPNIDFTEWATQFCVKDPEGNPQFTHKVDLGFGFEIEVPYAIPTPIRKVFHEFYVEQRVLRSGNRKRKVQNKPKYIQEKDGTRRQETDEERDARLEKFAKVNGLMVSIPNGCLIPDLSGIKDSEGNPERFMAPLVLFGVRNDPTTLKELEKFLKFRIEEINKKSDGKIYLNPSIKSLSRGASICGSFGLPLPVWDKRGRKGKPFAGEVFSPISTASDWTGQPSKFLTRHYAAVLHAIDCIDNSMSLKEARYVFNREVAIFKHKVNCMWNAEDPEAQKKAKELRERSVAIRKEAAVLKKAAIAADSSNRRGEFINKFNELVQELKEINKELKSFAPLKDGEKQWIEALMAQGYSELATKFPVFDSEDDNDEEDSENFNYTQYYWNLAKGSETVEGVDFGAKRSELTSNDTWSYLDEEEEFIGGELHKFNSHPTVKTLRRLSVDTIHKKLSSSPSSSSNDESSKSDDEMRKALAVWKKAKFYDRTFYGNITQECIDAAKAANPTFKCRKAADAARIKKIQAANSAKKASTVWYVKTVGKDGRTQWVRKNEDD